MDTVEIISNSGFDVLLKSLEIILIVCSGID